MRDRCFRAVGWFCIGVFPLATIVRAGIWTSATMSHNFVTGLYDVSAPGNLIEGGIMDSQEPTGDWLQRFIVDARRRNLCTEIFCTTCGAWEFRSGLRARLGVPVSGLMPAPLPPLGADHAERLLDRMSELKPPEHTMGFIPNLCD